jgi:hypothetical protein
LTRFAICWERKPRCDYEFWAMGGLTRWRENRRGGWDCTRNGCGTYMTVWVNRSFRVRGNKNAAGSSEIGKIPFLRRAIEPEVILKREFWIQEEWYHRDHIKMVTTTTMMIIIIDQRKRIMDPSGMIPQRPYQDGDDDDDDNNNRPRRSQRRNVDEDYWRRIIPWPIDLLEEISATVQITET